MADHRPMDLLNGVLGEQEQQEQTGSRHENIDHEAIETRSDDIDERLANAGQNRQENADMRDPMLHIWVQESSRVARYIRDQSIRHYRSVREGLDVIRNVLMGEQTDGAGALRSVDTARAMDETVGAGTQAPSSEPTVEVCESRPGLPQEWLRALQRSALERFDHSLAPSS